MEKSKDHTQTIVIAAILGVLALIIIAAVYFQNQTPRLYPGEVRDYQGENLSSISNIADNAIRGTQNLNQSMYHLTVNGLVNTPKEYTYGQIVGGFRNYEKVVTLYCVEGWNAKILWQGVLVRDLLNASGVNASAKVVIFHAADGYTTAMPLSYFYDNNIIMALK
jgi:DMSO/TMAO reductase YedYZ molybdopterin-dependent catalytic subunit